MKKGNVVRIKGNGSKMKWTVEEVDSNQVVCVNESGIKKTFDIEILELVPPKPPWIRRFS